MIASTEPRRADLRRLRRLGVDLTGTSVSGEHLEVRGVDLLEFVDGKITRKDCFWKIVK
jgi:ketosteroid isomerase-like protein